MWEIVHGLRLMLTRKEKFRLAGVVILLSGGALMEIAGLGLLLPLVAAFSKPELFEQNRALRLFRQLFSGPEKNAAFLCTAASICKRKAPSLKPPQRSG